MFNCNITLHWYLNLATKKRINIHFHNLKSVVTECDLLKNEALNIF